LKCLCLLLLSFFVQGVKEAFEALLQQQLFLVANGFSYSETDNMTSFERNFFIEQLTKKKEKEQSNA
jgi:hypothetical protein